MVGPAHSVYRLARFHGLADHDYRAFKLFLQLVSGISDAGLVTSLVRKFADIGRMGTRF